MRLLLVDDERKMADLLRQGLAEDGHSVTVATEGRNGLALAEAAEFDVIILDVMLPGLTGFEIAQRLRARHNQTPILMLTARDATSDVVKGLNLGADDYLTKPFSFEVLLARVRAVGRRGPIPQPVLLNSAGVVMDLGTREVRHSGRVVELTRTEFAILEVLMRNAGRVVTRDAFIESVWGNRSDIESNTLDAFVRLLRAKIEASGLIRTVRGVGYSLKADPSIRLRLTAWYSAVLLFGLVLFGLGMWFALRIRLVAGVDTRLDQRIRGVETAGTDGEMASRNSVQRELSEFAAEYPDNAFLQLRDLSGDIIVPFVGQQPFTERAPVRRTVDRGGRPFRVSAAQIEFGGRPYEVLVAGPLDEVEAVMSDFRKLLLLMIPGVLAVACLGEYWLSLRALRPVDEITRVAKSIGVQNLSQRVAVPATGDELQRMAETWNEVLERLESSVKRIRQLTADASHELRTPIALIRANAELALRRERSSEEYRNSLRSIEGEAEQMTALTESLLLLARADADGSQFTLVSTDLDAIVSRAIEQCQVRAAEKGISLQRQSNSSLRAYADASAIHRLLLILLDNSLKHTPAGGAVSVSIRAYDGSVALSVADTGEGIRAQNLPHIFERFYRSDPARSGGSGFGLGLSIAQAIAQGHGSLIRVESSPGAGASFTVALKIA